MSRMVLKSASGSLLWRKRPFWSYDLGVVWFFYDGSCTEKGGPFDGPVQSVTASVFRKRHTVTVIFPLLPFGFRLRFSFRSISVARTGLSRSARPRYPFSVCLEQRRISAIAPRVFPHIRNLNTSLAGRVRLIQQAMALHRTDKGIIGSSPVPVRPSYGFIDSVSSVSALKAKTSLNSRTWALLWRSMHSAHGVFAHS